MRKLKDKSKLETLKILRENGVSFKDISKVLNLDVVYLQHLSRVNNYKPLTQNKISSKELDRIGDQKINLQGFDKYKIGQITEYLVSAKLMSLGFDVYEPILANQPADLIISKNNKFNKIQVKTANYEKSRDCYVSSVFQIRGRKKIPYDKKLIDYIIIKCSGLDAMYIFPVNFFAKRLTIQLYPHRNLKQSPSSRKTNAEYYLNDFKQIEKN